MMKKLFQILNGLAFGTVIFVNYLSNTGAMGGKTIGSVSNNIQSLFTPAGYAFSIWGVIYLGLLGFILYQGKGLFGKVKNNDFVLRIGPWFILSSIANCLWVFSWVYGYTGLSCIFIFGLLFALMKIVTRLNIVDFLVLKPVKGLVILPFVIYTSWVTVASVANVSSYLVKINWDGFGVSSILWAIIMIVIASFINIIVLFKKNLTAFPYVGAWALFAIGIANKFNYVIVANTAFAFAVLLLIAGTCHLFHKNKPIFTKE